MAKIKKFILLITFAYVIIAPQYAFAAKVPANCGKRVWGVVPSIWDCLDSNNLELSDVPIVLGNIALVLLSFGGLIALIMSVAGGIQYIMSAGNPDMLRMAQNTLTYGIGGFILSIASWAIINYIMSSILG